MVHVDLKPISSELLRTIRLHFDTKKEANEYIRIYPFRDELKLQEIKYG